MRWQRFWWVFYFTFHAAQLIFHLGILNKCSFNIFLNNIIIIFFTIWGTLIFSGPTPLPFIGNALAIKKHDPRYLYKSFVKWSEIYGPVVGFFMGPKPLIAVCGYEAVQEALHNEDLNGRLENNLIKMRTFNQRLGKKEMQIKEINRNVLMKNDAVFY